MARIFSNELSGAIGGLYAGGECMLKEVRGVDDYKNAGLAAMIAGGVVGMKCKHALQTRVYVS